MQLKNNKKETFLCQNCLFHVFVNCHSQFFHSGSETSNIMVSPPNPQDVARGAGKEVILGDQRIEELFEQIGVAWKEVRMAWKEVQHFTTPGSCPIVVRWLLCFLKQVRLEKSWEFCQAFSWISATIKDHDGYMKLWYEKKLNWNSVQHETVYNRPYINCKTPMKPPPLHEKKMKNAFSAWKQHLTPAAW